MSSRQPVLLRWTNLAFCLACLVCAGAAIAAPAGESGAAGQAGGGAEGKTGTFTTTFSERSPLSDPKELMLRLGVKKLDPPTFDFDADKYVVTVPSDYDPSQQYGLFLLLNYKDSPTPPQPVLPVFQQRKLIFCTPVKVGRPAWVEVASGLDVVHNLSKRYNIAHNRVWLYSFSMRGDDKSPPAGQILALYYPDVVSGSFHQHGFRIWRPMKSARGGTFPAQAPPPPVKYAGEVRKGRPIVLATQSAPQEYDLVREKFVRSDGFKFVKTMLVNQEQCHYPNYTSDWIEESLDFLETNGPKPAAAPVKPATAPVRPATPAGTRPGVSPPTAVPTKPAR